MDHQSLRVLEFPHVQSFLYSLAFTDPGRQATTQVRPSADRGQIQVWLDQVTELKEYLQIGNSLPLGGIHELEPIIDRLRGTGEVLSPAVGEQLRTTVQQTGRIVGQSPATSGAGKEGRPRH